MKSAPTETAALRREQIVEAAVAVITEQGLHRLSLSEIEQRAGMCRGQLTYYFPTKEAILLAVFDRLLQLMYQQIDRPGGPAEHQTSGGWELIQHLFRVLLAGPPVSPQFHALQYTFLSQISHRADFRERLASLYEEWRTHMAQSLTRDREQRSEARDQRSEVRNQRSEPRDVSPRAMATLVQALLHGLALQATADANAFDREEMLDLCLDLLGSYLGARATPSASTVTKKSPRKAETSRARAIQPAGQE